MQGTWSFALLCLGICPDWYHINTADSHAWHNYVADGYCWTDMTVRPPVHIRYCRCCNWDCVQRILQPAMPALSLSCSLICKLCIWVCICMHVEYKAQRKSQKSLRDCINIELPELQWKRNIWDYSASWLILTCWIVLICVINLWSMSQHRWRPASGQHLYQCYDCCHA